MEKMNEKTVREKVHPHIKKGGALRCSKTRSTSIRLYGMFRPVANPIFWNR